MVRQSVLVVEDEEDIRELVSYNLLKDGYQVAGVATGEEALVAVESKMPDLILLDIMLPGLDGLRVCRKLKDNPKFESIPIIMLTAKGEEPDIVAGLNMGADDYVTKPFSPKVLLARIQAVLRRAEIERDASPDEDEDTEVVEIRDLMIHPGRHEVFVCGKPIELTATEFKLLHLLAQRPGWVFTRQQILDGVHGDNYAITDRAVDVQIVGLRRKLGEAGNCIETVRGVGYRFKEQELLMRKKRLWWRLFISYLWVPAAVLLSIGWYGSDVVWDLYESHLKSDLEARARLCGKPIEDMLTRDQAAEVDALCKELGRSSNTRITVVLPSGEVVGDSNENPRDMDNHGNRPEIREAFGGHAAGSQRYSFTEREEHIYVAVPLMHGSSSIAVVRTSLPVTALSHTLAIVRNRIILAGLIGLVLHAVTTWAISRRLSHPLEQIKIGAERFAAGNLKHRLPVMDSVEIGTLAETMNRMAEQLDERIQIVLRQQNEREAMLSSMEEGVLAINNEGTILSLNEACATLLGEAPARLQGRSIYEVIRKADLLAFVELALASASPVEGEIQLRGAQDRWVSAHGTVLHDSQRGKIGVLVVLHDITRLRHLEDVRRDFVANVSHELRTPITSIKGFLETLVDGAYEDKENAHRFLQIMLRQVNRLDAIIGDLLVLSRIERGSDEQLIELAPEPIRAMLQAAIEMCEKKASGKAIKIDLVCAEDLTAEINAALLEQAVVNLLDNAIKYSNSEAVIEVRAACEGADLAIRVKDQGCGIDAQHLPRLFERFYRVDKARSRELGGTGLGLAIVRHIALAHRGSISVESALGTGSTFCLRLPKSRAKLPS